MTIPEFIQRYPTEAVFIAALVIYALLIGFVSYRFSKSGNQVAHENFPKTVKHITEGFVGIIAFLLLFYLAAARLLPIEALIAIVSVFTTAGFLSLRNRE